MTVSPTASEPRASGFGSPGDPDRASLVDGKALADLATAPVDAVADRARRGLSPVLAHSGLVLVMSGWPVPVQIAAPDEIGESLARPDWMRLLADHRPVEQRVARMDLPDRVGGLALAGWIAESGGFTVALIVADRSPFHLTAGQERSAMRVVMQVAARARTIDVDPPPGALAFSRAMSHERERIRLSSSRYAANLSLLLQTLRNATEAGGMRTPGVAKAIDMASQALLDLQAESDVRDFADAIPIAAAFAEIEQEAAETLQAAGVQLIADLGGDTHTHSHLPSSVVHAARLVTRAAVLGAIEQAGADKFRLLWRISDEALIVLIADNNAGSGLAVEPVVHRFEVIRRWVSELRGDVSWDVTPHWGTALRCWLPLHQAISVPETPAARRLAELGGREREVLELMVAGLRNRGIAERLYISERTVKFHVSNILAKLCVESRTEAIALAHRAGFSIPPGGGAD